MEHLLHLVPEVIPDDPATKARLARIEAAKRARQISFTFNDDIEFML